MTDAITISKPARPLIWAIASFFAALIPATTTFYLRCGTGFSLLGEFRQLIPFVYGLTALAGICICFLAIARCHAVNDAISFWIGIAFSTAVTMMSMYVLASPSTLTTGPVILCRSPGNAVWIIEIAAAMLAALLCPATVSKQFLKNFRLVYFAGAVVAALGISAILLFFAGSLPPLVDGADRFTWAIWVINGVAAAIMAAGAALSIMRYYRGGESLAGYLALSQSIFFAALGIFFLSTRRFDLWWCAARFFSLAGCAVLLYGLLSGYAGLYKSELEKADALRREIADLEKADELLKDRAQALAAANEELEAFSYSVSHDLRTQLHIMTAFTYLLSDEFGGRLGAEGRDYLRRVSTSIEKMNTIISCILRLTRISQREISISDVNMSRIACSLIDELRQVEPKRQVQASIQEGLLTRADEPLITVALTNLIRNAWKFTGGKADARIEIGKTGENGSELFFIRDNGAGFEPLHADQLFRPFRRLHQEDEFPGTGIGLAIVDRVIRRHGGKVWAEGRPGEGACFYFSLPLEEGRWEKGRDQRLEGKGQRPEASNSRKRVGSD